MKKNSFQDIVPPKKSIRNIEIPSRRPKIENPIPEKIIPEKPIVEKPIMEEKEKFPRPTFDYSSLPSQPADKPVTDSLYKYQYDEPKKPSRKVIYAVLIVLVLALAFGISAFFKSAKITVEPKSQIVHLNSNFIADQNATSGLSFQIVTISKDVQKTVTSSGQTEVQKKASGTVTIFNNTTGSQKLIATTRLETPEGLIFHLNSAVTVPARQIVSGSVVPGSVSVVATADQVGDKYNVGLKDFTIPGLKSDATKYSQITAKSKTPMAGGFSGMQATISSQDLASTSAELQNDLRTSLSSNIASQIPANFILYPNSMTFSFLPVNQASTTANQTILDEKGTAHGVIFDRGALSRAIAALYSVSDTIKIDNLDSLNFSYATSTQFDPFGKAGILNFFLSGDANIVWVFDTNKLKTELLGLSKDQAKTVISGYPAISEVWIETSPFWNQTIPTDPKKVELLTK